MNDNSYVLSRAIKYTLDLAENSGEKNDYNGDMKEVYRDLNKCRIFYEQKGIDFKSMIL